VSFVQASDGAEIFYRAAGEGPPLILCTASFSTHLHWSGVESALAEHYRVVTWDYRGHGRSEAPEDPERYSLAQVVDDLGAVHRAAAGDEPAFVGGLSVGGLVTLSYALAQPEQVRAVLLFNTGPGFKKPEALAGWNEMLEKAASKMEAVGLEVYLDGRRAQAELLGLNPESPGSAAVRSGVLASSVAGLTRFARRVAGPVPNLVDRLSEVKQPALVLVGALDPAFQRAGEVMAAKLPNASHVVLDGAGHVMNLDRPDAFVGAVRHFLAPL
jgi:pimeloyl-ACP methyl ester carboxylesterase